MTSFFVSNYIVIPSIIAMYGFLKFPISSLFLYSLRKNSFPLLTEPSTTALTSPPAQKDLSPAPLMITSFVSLLLWNSFSAEYMTLEQNIFRAHNKKIIKKNLLNHFCVNGIQCFRSIERDNTGSAFLIN